MGHKHTITSNSHYAKSAPSNRALGALRAALSGPYPPDKPSNPPLEFNLSVVEGSPTPDQMRTILSYISPRAAASPVSTFVSAHPASAGKTETIHDAKDVSELGRNHPNALKWPIVVDWTGGYACVGDVDGVHSLLEVIRKQRDGETKEEVDKPKGWFS